jgi:phage repressor protein C with HTH and peptisase S24 domain
MNDPVRRLVAKRIKDLGLNLAEVSRQIGMNAAYMQQFLERGIPRKLKEEQREKLATILKVDEVLLGAPLKSRHRAPPAPDGPVPDPEELSSEDVASGFHRDRVGEDGEKSYLPVPVHDIRVSAGHGTLIDAESVTGSWPFPQRYIRDALSIRTRNLSIIEVIGDSMEPTLKSGDRIMVDLDDRDPTNPGIFALYDGDATVVKRVEKVPASDRVMLISDNPLHNNYEVLASVVSIAGRVVWFGRKL